MACEPLNKDQFIELWQRVLPRSYTAPIKDERAGRGMDVPCLQARIWELFCENLEISQQAYYLLPHSTQTRPESSGQGKATGVVFLQRSAPVLGDIVVPQGTVFEARVTDSFGDSLLIGRYLSTLPVVLPEGDGQPILIPVEAEFPGYAGNIVAGLINNAEPQTRLDTPATLTSTSVAQQIIDPTTVNDAWSVAVVGRLARLVGPLVSENADLPRRITSFTDGSPQQISFDPPLDDAADVGVDIVVEIESLEDFGITVTQPQPITGGVGGTLDAIATDRNQGRVLGESDDELRQRLSELADTISPAAIERTLDCILTPCGIRFDVAETGDIEGLMGFTWDLHPYDFGQVLPISKPPGSEYVGQGGVFLDESMYRRFFIITVSCNDNAQDFGLAYDDGPLPNAWDGDQPYDGGSVDPLNTYNTCIARAWEAVNAARAAGVGFIIVQDCNL
jgi:hypothetical protein